MRGSRTRPIRACRAWLRKLAGATLLGVALAGCAASLAYRDGKEFSAKGQYDEALGKFQEAAAQEPRNVEYRMAYVQARERALATRNEQAAAHAQAGRYAEAQRLYQQVLALDRRNDRALAGLQRIDMQQRHTGLINEAAGAWARKDRDAAFKGIQAILRDDPHHAQALALREQILAQPVELHAEAALAAAYRKPISVEFKDIPLKSLFEVIARASGLNFMFDKDVKGDQKTSLYLKNSTIEAAVYSALLTNQLEMQVLNGNTILVYPNTAAKQKEYQEMVVRSFYLANADAAAVANTIKTIVKTRDVVVDDKLNMLIVRDSPDAVKLAAQLVALHDVPEPEVMLEVEILEVNRSRLQELGIRWPDSLSLTPLAGTTDAPLTLRDLRSLNSGRIDVGNPTVSINARRDDVDANILANPRIRARNHEKAKIMIGERLPNITTTATSTGFVAESITYVDVGLKLEVEPTIYLDNDVAIKISLEVSNLVGQLQTKSGAIAYQIGTRNASTVLRLKDGENQVLAGLINDEDRRTANKLPGLGEIPALGRLFGSTLDDGRKTEIVLSITPHLIRNITRPHAAQSQFWAGTDASLRARPLSLSAGAAPAASVAAPGSDGSGKVVPGPAADGAAAPATGGERSTAPAATGSTPAENGNAAAPVPPGALLQWQGPAQVNVGDAFSVDLVLQSAQPVGRFPVKLSFDNRVLQVGKVTEGDFLKQGGAPTTFTSKVEPNGQIIIEGVRNSATGAIGDGTVVTIQFVALRPAVASRLLVASVMAADPAGMSIATKADAALQLRVAR